MIFPNATVYVDKRETEYWLNGANADKVPTGQKKLFQEAKITVGPYVQAGKVKTFDGDTQLMPGIRSIASWGHTPGHSFFALESRGQKMVFWGDIMHAAAVQFPEPSATIVYDSDSKKAAAQRKKAYAEAAKEGYWLAIDHVSFPGIGHLRAESKGYSWIPVNYSYTSNR